MSRFFRKTGLLLVAGKLHKYAMKSRAVGGYPASSSFLKIPQQNCNKGLSALVGSQLGSGGENASAAPRFI